MSPGDRTHGLHPSRALVAGASLPSVLPEIRDEAPRQPRLLRDRIAPPPPRRTRPPPRRLVQPLLRKAGQGSATRTYAPTGLSLPLTRRARRASTTVPEGSWS